MAWNPPPWTSGDRIRKAREAAGLEQRALADATGLNKNTISNVEKGLFPTKESTFRLLAHALAEPLGARDEQVLAWLRDGSLLD